MRSARTGVALMASHPWTACGPDLLMSLWSVHGHQLQARLLSAVEPILNVSGLPYGSTALTRSSPSDPRVGSFTWDFVLHGAGVLTTRPRDGG